MIWIVLLLALLAAYVGSFYLTCTSFKDTTTSPWLSSFLCAIYFPIVWLLSRLF